MEKTYTVTLADGTRIENLELNGNNFVTDEPIKEEIFQGNLSTVTFSDGEHEDVHHNMELIQLIQSGGRHWFILRDIPAEKMERMKIQADIAYIAMMAGVEL